MLITKQKQARRYYFSLRLLKLASITKAKLTLEDCRKVFLSATIEAYNYKSVK